MDLSGITRGLDKTVEWQNPSQHSPFAAANRVIIERHSSDGETERVETVETDNVLCTVGLNHLCELLQSSALAFSATNGWVQTGAIGTGDTAATSNDTALANSTASVHISSASMAASDKGNRTYEAQMTFDDSNAYTIKEVGLFASNGATGSAIARSVLATSDQVIKGTGDTVNVSYQLIFTTA